ncbi:MULTISPECIES: hypothetical protein [Vibrio]|uniref:PepSY domain-containing protein n=1 Tax=Vibrio halioticoli NBRC 102217 TaxID=1219072 RepID=V5F3F6_9VIBR|nr:MULTISPECIES: hypothetical protein [Vibrio]MPW37387.1 hypothetical protein [Vibrio sp. B1Z05]GAD89709.1 hypothetical protein VHA01S_026_00150 [Vibrio halioticoli NBRC 102217]
MKLTLPTIGLLSAVLITMPIAHANDQQDAAIGLMALNSGSATITTLAPQVRTVSTGVITEIELDDYKDTQIAYKFKVIDTKAGKKFKLTYAINDGSLLREKSENLSTLGFSDLDREDRNAIEQVEKAQFDIVKKLIELETKYSAKTLEAELESKKGVVFYEVELASTERGMQKLLINVATGEEIPVMHRQSHK